MTSVERVATHPRTVNIFGYEVFNQPLSTISLVGDRCRTLNTIGPDTYGISVSDPVAAAAFKASDYLVLDGVYFALGSILTRGETITPNQGPDVFDHFMRRLNDSGGRAFFLGAAPATIEKIKARTAELYPNIVCDGLSPPFKPEFTEEDHDAMIAAVNAFRPDIVFIGMSAPKQEKWAHRNAPRLNAKLTVAIGAVFDWYSGVVPPLAPWWFRYRLAWLGRIVQRPRNIVRIKLKAIFLWHLLQAVLRLRPSRA
ncbi:WecB/TagA/CpsF family glycosyltransferase [Sphingomonas sp. MS122]|uniref:WecB/TagA/CpsF family glycosyltransferase n=1 Tax=Sphingomonas sp. MS122 TaxID=3412683 RepID=UPI003C2CFD62